MAAARRSTTTTAAPGTTRSVRFDRFLFFTFRSLSEAESSLRIWALAENFWYSSDGVKMDYGGHDSNFERNLVVVNAYDGQNCINGG